MLGEYSIQHQMARFYKIHADWPGYCKYREALQKKAKAHGSGLCKKNPVALIN